MTEIDSRLVTLVVLVAIAGIVYYAYFQQPGSTEQLQSMQNVSPSLGLRSISLVDSSAWQIPETNVSFRHNVSIENGTRIDFVTLKNNGSNVNLNLLVIVPKTIAQRASQVSLTGNPRVLNDDPEFLYENVVFVAIGPQSREFALVVDVSRSLEEGGVMYIPISGLQSADDIVDLATIFSDYSDVLDSLNAREAFEVEYRLTQIVSQVRPVNELLRDVDTYLSNLRSPPSGQGAVLASISPLTAKVSIYSPLDVVSFEICKLPDCSSAEGFESARPLVRVEGEVAEYARIIYSDATDPAKVKVDINIDVTRVEIKAADLEINDRNGNPKESLTGTVIVVYPGNLNAQVTAPIVVERHLAQPVRVVPTAIPAGAGGSFVLATSDLPFLLNGVTSNCFAEPINLPGASPLGATAIALYIAPSAKRLTPTCRFAQNGKIIPNVEFRVDSRSVKQSGLSQLLPVVATANSWQTCAENFCTCDAARDALGYALVKVREDALNYYGPRYPFTSFQELFVFNLANFDSTCNFGVEFSSTARPKPGAVQLIIIKVDPNNVNAPARAAAFHDEENYIPGVIAASIDDVVPDRQVKKAIASQWLCHDSQGLPSAHPEDECSRELRNPPVITVAARPQ